MHMPYMFLLRQSLNLLRTLAPFPPYYSSNFVVMIVIIPNINTALMSLVHALRASAETREHDVRYKNVLAPLAIRDILTHRALRPLITRVSYFEGRFRSKILRSCDLIAP